MSTTPNALEAAAAKKHYGTGRRREAVARVYIKPGSGKFTVNGRPVEQYFRNVAWHTTAVEPLKFTQTLEQLDVTCYRQGRRGGRAGRSGAHGNFARPGPVQPRVTPRFAHQRFPDPRFAHEGTQEVRTEGRTPPLPVQQALDFYRPRFIAGPEFTAGKGPAQKDAAAERQPAWQDWRYPPVRPSIHSNRRKLGS